MKFPGRKDQFGRMASIGGIVAILLNSLALVVFGNRPNQVEGAVFILVAVPSWLASWPRRYEVRDGAVYIYASRFMIQEIDLADVTRVYESRQTALQERVLKTPSLRLSTKKREMLVTPADPVAFLEEIERQAPHLRRYGSELRSFGRPNLVLVNNSASGPPLV